MKLSRLRLEPAATLEFTERIASRMGALCEQTWHNRLSVVAEGPAARPWTGDEALFHREIQFPEANATGSRNASSEIFPGCPILFRLCEALWPEPLNLERIILKPDKEPRPPAPEVADKLWRMQIPEHDRWTFGPPWVPSWHFSVLFLTRCEIQAIDQHWSLHRIVLSWPDGVPDIELESDLATAGIDSSSSHLDLDWVNPDPARCAEILANALAHELGSEIRFIRERQRKYLQRELDRIDVYFENYRHELQERSRRTRSAVESSKHEDRIAAANIEHGRRREDQITRHEIRVIPHLDASLLIAEPCWSCKVTTRHRHRAQAQVPAPTESTENPRAAKFIPRSRQWRLDAP